MELVSRTTGGIGPAEENRGDTTADAVWSIGDDAFPDRADGLGEVILETQKVGHLLVSCNGCRIERPSAGMWHASHPLVSTRPTNARARPTTADSTLSMPSPQTRRHHSRTFLRPQSIGSRSSRIFSTLKSVFRKSVAQAQTSTSPTSSLTRTRARVGEGGLHPGVDRRRGTETHWIGMAPALRAKGLGRRPECPNRRTTTAMKLKGAARAHRRHTLICVSVTSPGCDMVLAGDCAGQ